MNSSSSTSAFSFSVTGVIAVEVNDAAANPREYDAALYGTFLDFGFVGDEVFFRGLSSALTL
jgi:hypothetical protein